MGVPVRGWVARELLAAARVLVVGQQRGKQYESLNDAAVRYPRLKGLAPGRTEIWYAKSLRDYSGGFDRLEQYDVEIPNVQNIKKTHKLIGKIKETNPERIFSMLQGESWSPQGEAFDLISGLDLHTSMSVGDIIKVGNKLLFVDRVGFEEL